MAALNFPSTGLVANVTTYTENGKTYLWDGVSWLNITKGPQGIQGTQGITGSRICTWYFDGTTESTTENEVMTSVASYIQLNEDLNFKAGPRSQAVFVG